MDFESGLGSIFLTFSSVQNSENRNKICEHIRMSSNFPKWHLRLKMNLGTIKCGMA